MSGKRRRLGERGESLAAEELMRRGYVIVERNWRCTEGETDIVAQRDDVWTFFEVRTRRGCDFGTPEESITLAKQQRMARVALSYLAEHDVGEADWRLGAVAVECDQAGRLLRLEVYDSVG